MNNMSKASKEKKNLKEVKDFSNIWIKASKEVHSKLLKKGCSDSWTYTQHVECGLDILFTREDLSIDSADFDYNYKHLLDEVILENNTFYYVNEELINEQ